MMSEWKEYRVEDIALDSPHAMSTGPFGSAISSKFFQERGVPVIRGGNLSADVTDRMSDDGLVFISEEKAREFKRSVVRPGDLIFTCWGTINQVGLITAELEYPEYIISNKQMKLTVDPLKADYLFVYYLFSSPLKQAEILNNGIGAAVPGFNLGQLKGRIVNLPPVGEQRRIASILNSFDEKIRHNRQTNQTLEQIAQAIFKSWFVDFEPTRAKISAKQRWKAINETTECSSPTCYAEELDSANQHARLKNQSLDDAMTQAAMAAISGKTVDELENLSPEQQEQLKATAALFPDVLVESELGEIPEGWEAEPFGNLLIKTIGGDWGKEEPDDKHTEKVKILRGTDLPDVYAGSDDRVPTRYVDPKKLATRKLEAGDIVIEVSGGSPTQPTGRSLYLTQEIIGRLNAELEPASFCRLFRPVEYSVGLILGLHLQKIYADGKTWLYQNTSTGISNFQTKVFLEKELVVVPPEEIKQRFYGLVMPYIQKMSSGENKILAELRDTLLPRLLSGELSTNHNIEAVV